MSCRLLASGKLSPITEHEEDAQTAKQVVSAVDMVVKQEHKRHLASVSNEAMSTVAAKQQTCSGTDRKREETEVLKQKYINKDIQDLQLPRFPSGHGRHGRLHRAKSKLNLGSQDIRRQLGKLRAMIDKYNRITETSRQTHRKSKGRNQVSAVRVISNTSSSSQLDCPGDIVDDFEPELVALFENFIDERDRRRRENLVCETLLTSEVSGKNDCKHESHEAETTNTAYMRGFLQGLNHKILKNACLGIPCGAPKTDNEPCGEASPSAGSQSYRDLIANNQDVTHKYLRQWEYDFSHSAQTRNSDARKAEVRRSRRVSDIQSAYLSTHDVNKLTSQVFQESGNSTKPTSTEQLSSDDPPKEPIPVANLVDLAGEHCHVKTEAPKDISEQAHEAVSIAYSEERLSLQDTCQVPVDRRQGFTNHGVPSAQELSGASQQPNSRLEPLNLLKRDEFDLVKMAKQKLEHKSMSSLAFEQQCLNRLQGKLVGSHHLKKRDREKKRQSAKTSVKFGQSPDAITLDDLDGWSTEIKPSHDVDGLHLSASGLLHPVDVTGQQEEWHMIEDACTELEERDVNTASESSDELLGLSESHSDDTRQDLSDDVSNLDGSHGFIDSRLASEQTVCDSTTSSNDGKGTKSPSVFPADYKKAINMIKLRMNKIDGRAGTSSSQSTPANKSERRLTSSNVPISHCASYNMEQTMRSALSATVTANINLSQTLARQLKDLSQNKQPSKACQDNRTPPRTYETRYRKPEIRSSYQDSDEDIKSPPPLCISSLNDSKSVNDVFRLPEICTKQEHAGLVPSKAIVRQKGRINLTQEETIELPPISITPIPRDISPSQVAEISGGGATEHAARDACQSRGSIAVRSSVCTSPYLFDREDLANLNVKAKHIPNSHTVCTCCGEIRDSGRKCSKGKICHKFVQRVNKKLTPMPARLCNEEFTGYPSWHPEYSVSMWDKPSPHVVGESVNKTENVSGTKVKQSSNTPSDNSVPVLSKRHLDEELSMKFMEQNIKVKFQCELSVDNCKADTSKQDIVKADRLLDVSKTLQKPSINHEINVNRKHVNKKSFHDKSCRRQLSSSGQEDASPYLEFCKLQAAKRRGGEQRAPEMISRSGNEVEVIPVTSRKPGDAVNDFPVTSRKTARSKRKAGVVKPHSGSSTYVISERHRKSKHSLLVPLGHLPTVQMRNTGNKTPASLEPLVPCNSLARLELRKKH